MQTAIAPTPFPQQLRGSFSLALWCTPSLAGQSGSRELGFIQNESNQKRGKLNETMK